jgi:hypothetical protein
VGGVGGADFDSIVVGLFFRDTFVEKKYEKYCVY